MSFKVPQASVSIHDNTFGEGHRFGNRSKGSDGGRESHHRRSELGIRDQDGKDLERQMERKEKELNYKEDRDRRATERRSGRHDSNPSEEHDRRGEDQDTRGTERRSKRHDFELKEDDRKEEDWDMQATERKYRKPGFETNTKDEHDGREEKRSRRHELESKPKEDRCRRGEKQSRRHESESYQREDHRVERGNKWLSGHSRDTASHRHP